MSSRCQNKQGGALLRAKTARVMFNTHLLPSGLGKFRMLQRLRHRANRNFRHRWSRSFTGSADALLRPVADFTASGEFHPALKTSYPVVALHYTIGQGKMQDLIFTKRRKGLTGVRRQPHSAIYGQFEKLCLTLYANGKKYIKISLRKKTGVVQTWRSPNLSVCF